MCARSMANPYGLGRLFRPARRRSGAAIDALVAVRGELTEPSPFHCPRTAAPTDR